MAWAPTRNSRPWRDFLTEDEAREVLRLEQSRKSHRQALAEIRFALAPIQNRATVRAGKQ